MKFTVNVEVFSHRIYFFIGDEEREAFKEKTGITLLDDNADGRCSHNNVWIKNEDQILLVHEIYHAMSFLVNAHGLEGDEVRAYVMAYIFSKAMEEIKREII